MLPGGDDALSGLYHVKPALFGVTDNYITDSDKYGKQYQRSRTWTSPRARSSTSEIHMLAGGAACHPAGHARDHRFIPRGRWLTPTSIMTARCAKVSVQVDFSSPMQHEASCVQLRWSFTRAKWRKLISNRQVHQTAKSSSLRDTYSTEEPTWSRETSAGLRVPRSFVRLLYISLVCFNGLLILVTLLSDLGMTLPRGLGQFDLKLEGNFATWYSSALLLLAGGAALLISVSPAPARVLPKVYRAAWTTTSLVLLALSLDEMNELHERVGFWFTERFGRVPGFTEGGYAIFGWVVALLPFIALSIAGMGAMIHTWIRADRRSRNLATAALWCWIGVVAAEVTEAEMVRFSMNRSVEGVVEEGLEITGTALFFAAFCEFLRSQETPVHKGRKTRSLA